MKPNHAHKVLAYMICCDNNVNTFAENNTTVMVDDEAAGPFIVLKQCRDDSNKEDIIKLDFDEFPVLMECVEKLKAEWDV